MNAKTMFEKLGYKQTDKLPTYIEYLKKGNAAIIEITFDLENKRVIKEDFNTGYSYYIKYDELQAINKQIEELGGIMNDEIKEILDNVRKCCDITKDQSFVVYQRQDILKLLDCITNLQEQLHQASLDIQELTERDIECPSWCDKLTNLQQENERLKQDYINIKNYIVIRKIDSKVQDKATLYNIELENINKKRHEDYKSRCEKAVEYLKNNCYIDDCLITYEAIDITNVMDILNGRSDE